MTLLQMTGMYQAIANDGVRIPPRIIKATIAPDGTRTDEPRPEGVRVVSPQTAQTVRKMLRAVVQRDPMGTSRAPGRRPRSTGYQIAGKTGTAQQINPACGCYYERRLLDHLRRHGHRRRPPLRHRHHGRQPAPHRRRLSRARRRRRCSTTSPSWLLQRENVPLSPDPGPAADAASHLNSAGRLPVRPVLCQGHEAASLASRRPGARAAGRPGGRDHQRRPMRRREVAVTGVTLRGQDAQPGPVRRAARRVGARRPIRRRRGRARRGRGAHRRGRRGRDGPPTRRCPCWSTRPAVGARRAGRRGLRQSVGARCGSSGSPARRARPPPPIWSRPACGRRAGSPG